MSGSTSVPKPVFGERGFSSPPEGDILSGRFSDIDAAFGGGLNPALTSPQGQLASSDAAIIADLYDQWCLLTQSVDPAHASGRMQEAIGRIYFLDRLAAQPTTVSALCSGLAGVIIPQGSLAKDASGSVYACTDGGVIGSGGSVALDFANLTDGPLPCPTGALNTIYRTIPGWDEITNASDGVLGRDVESRAEFERRRWDSVQSNSTGSVGAVRGAVLAVPDLLDVYVTENDTDADTGPFDGVTLLAHSIYVCVAGGDNEAIARAIWSRKSGGCAMTGDTDVTFEDMTDPHGPPFPEHSVTFQTAVAMDFTIRVTLADIDSVPADALALIAPVILAAFAGSDGGTRARINSLVLASRYYAPVQSLGQWAQIITIEVAEAGVSPSWDDSVQVGIAHVPALAAEDILLVLA